MRITKANRIALVVATVTIAAVLAGIAEVRAPAGQGGLVVPAARVAGHARKAAAPVETADKRAAHGVMMIAVGKASVHGHLR